MYGQSVFKSVMQSDHYDFWAAPTFLRGTILLKAFSKSVGFSDAPTSRAVSTKRAWRSASVSFGRGRNLFFATGFFRVSRFALVDFVGIL